MKHSIAVRQVLKLKPWTRAKCDMIPEEEASSDDETSAGDTEGRDSLSESEKELTALPTSSGFDGGAPAPEVPWPRMAMRSCGDSKPNVASQASAQAVPGTRFGKGSPRDSSFLAGEELERETNFVVTPCEERPACVQGARRNRISKKESKSGSTMARRLQQQQEIADVSGAVPKAEIAACAAAVQGQLAARGQRMLRKTLGSQELVQNACPSCGCGIEPHHNFCRFCGHRVA